MNAKRFSWKFPLWLAGLLLHSNIGFAADETVKLPSGPVGTKRFGAYQTLLKFTPEWDAPWRIGPKSDVVVAFDDTSARMVFWHGSNYVPCWVNENGVWYSNGAVTRENAGPQHDRLCLFSFAIVVESNDARAVVRWRYAPTDEKGELINADPVTRWNDWVDEYYTIYPDATAVRSVTLHSSEWTQPYSLQQSIMIRQPGAASGPRGDSKSEEMAGGLLRWIDLEGGKPFHAAAGEVAKVEPPSPWGDWPARGAAIQAGHEFLDSLKWQPYSETTTSRSWRMLIGMASSNGTKPADVAQSWLEAPNLRIVGGACTSSGYQPDEKAYLLHSTQPGKPGEIRLKLDASPSSPLINPAFVIKNWGRSPASLLLNGKQMPTGKDFRCGFRKTAAGADLIMWIRAELKQATTLEISTIKNSHE